MTAFITHCWKKHRSALALLCAGLFWLGGALAGAIEPRQATLVPDEAGQALNAEFTLDLGPRLEEAASRGVTLYFHLEFTLVRKRWYWFDEHIATRNFDYKLSFQALTRQFRLISGTQTQNYDTLDEAIKALGRVMRLHVVEKAELVAGESYRAAVRLSLDHGQLPKPLQVDALADRDWRVDSKILRWDFTATPEK